jgi:hypothetical protein
MAEKYLSAEEHHAMRGQKQQSSSALKPILVIIVMLVVAGLSFFGGVQYQKGHKITTISSSGQPGSTGGFGSGGRRFNGQRPTLGQVTAVSPSSITVQNQSGTSTTLAITSATTINDNGQTVTTTDISVGETVAVIASSSDSTQASRILVNPSFGGGASPPSSSSGSGQSTTN